MGRLPLFLCCCSVSLLVACGATKTSDVRIRSSAQDHFYVQNDFESVYQDILQKFDACHVAKTEQNINKLGGSAQIVSRSIGGPSMLVDIFRVEDTQTRVDVYAPNAVRVQVPRYGAFGKDGCPR